MKESGLRNAACGADTFGLKDLAAVHWNLDRSAALRARHPQRRGHRSSPAARSAPRPAITPAARRRTSTPRSMRSPRTRSGGTATASRARSTSTTCSRTSCAHAKGKTLYAQDLYGGADPKYRIKARVYTEYAWHSLFIRQLLIRPERAELASYVPDMTIIDMPSFKPDHKRHGGREGSDTQVAIDFTRKIVLICGSSYAGEMKKSVFTTLNFYLPAQGVMPMHCSANVSQGRQGKRAVLRPVRHRQDHAVGRSEPHPDRRRRDRLVAGGHLQFRGRLLRQDHQVLAGSRADDLGRHQPLRRGAGERGVRSGDPHPGLRQRQADREHPLGLSARFHSERVAHRAWRATRRTSSSSPPTPMA